MANDKDQAVIEIAGDERKLEQALKNSTDMFQKFGRTVKRIGAAVLAAFAVQKLVSMIKAAVRAGLQQEEQLFKLERMLHVTGERAGFTAEQFEQMAKDIQASTRFTDDAARAAQTAVLKFQNIKGDIFRDTVKSAADLAVVTGQDLKSAAVQLASALDEPNRAIAMMDSLGATLSMRQEILVRRLFAVGRIADAQRVILNKLNDTYGGSAQRDLETFSGRWAQLGGRWEDVKQRIGRALIPALETIIPMVEKVLSWMQLFGAAVSEHVIPTVTQSWMSFIDTLGPIIDVAKDIVSTLIETWRSLMASFSETILPAFGNGWKKTVQFIADLLRTLQVGFVVALTLIETAITNWRDVVSVVLNSFALAAVKSFNIVTHFLTKTMPEALSWFKRNWREVFSTSWNFMKTTFSNMAENAKRFGRSLKSFFQGKGWDFKWKGLLDGFESTIKEMPKFTKRIPTELEKELASKIATSGQRLGDAFQKKLRERLGRIEDIKTDLFPEVDEQRAKEEKARVDLTPNTGKFGTFGSKQKPQLPQTAGSFEGLEQLNKRIQSAAAKRPEVRLLEQLHKFQFKAHGESQQFRRRQAQAAEKGAKANEESVSILMDMSKRPGGAVFA